jgi:hypothetical protein
MIISAFTLRAIVMVGGLKKRGHAVESLGSRAGIDGACGGRLSLIFCGQWRECSDINLLRNQSER